MDLLARFKKYLEAQKNPPSYLTVKNYLSDIRQFITWYETTQQQEFKPKQITKLLIDAYINYRKNLNSASVRSTERYLSSLRKFFDFLKEKKYISSNPLKDQNRLTNNPDPWKLKAFKDYLYVYNASNLTIKNYINDVKQFLDWVAKSSGIKTPDQDTITFWRNTKINIFSLINKELLQKYRSYLLSQLKLSENLYLEKQNKDINTTTIQQSGNAISLSDSKEATATDLNTKQGLSILSINRKLSSLRKFLSWAQDEGLVQIDLSSLSNIRRTAEVKAISSEDAQRTFTGPSAAGESEKTQLISHLAPLDDSSKDNQNDKYPSRQIETLDTEQKHKYSSFPPLRLIQKLVKATLLGIDLTIIAGIAKLLEQITYIKWLASGKQIFIKSAKKQLDFIVNKNIKSTLDNTQPENRFSSIVDLVSKENPRLEKNSNTQYHIPNIKSRFHPAHPEFTTLPLHYRILGHLRHTRPQWYIKYHQYPIVHYFHFAALIIFMSVIGFGLYRSFFEQPQKEKTLAAPPTAPPRILSFQGRLTDISDNPITSATPLRFAIYNDLTASGSALLWQEVQTVTPDTDGVFSVLLGTNTTIPSSVFTDNSSLYLGVTVQTDPELTPRQQIATVAFAANSETLQGLYPITAAGAGTSNVVLALDSSGNLTIGGSATPKFSATGGEFTLSGNVLSLTTNVGSNTNINISPDGKGVVNIIKPLQNTSLNNNITTAAGAVEVDDLFAVLATSSGQSAFTINQNGAGPLISASSSGIAKFTVNNDGSAYFAGNVGIGITSPTGILSLANSAAGVEILFSGANAANIYQSTSGQSLYINTNTGDLRLGANGSGSNDLVIKSTGNIGIGNTTASNFKLEVTGNIGPSADVTYNLGSPSLRWNNVYANNFIGSGTGGTAGYWQLNNGALSPAYSTNDVLIGGTATSSAKFGFINVIGSGTPTATISGNFSIQVPTGTNPAIKINALNGGSINFQTATTGQGDAGLTSRLFINNNGNVGIGTTNPTNASLHINGTEYISGNVGIGAAPGAGGSTKVYISSALSSGLYVTNIGDGSNAQGASFRGNASSPLFSTIGAIGSAWGNSTTGTQNQLVGISGVATWDRANNIVKAAGVLGSVAEYNSGATGNITTGYALVGSAVTADGAGKLFADGITYTSGGGTGSVINMIGLYLGDVVNRTDPTPPSGDFAIYSAGGNSYFAGNVGIGVNNPAWKLDVRGGNIQTGGMGSGADYGIILTSSDTGTYGWISNIGSQDAIQIGSGQTIGTSPLITLKVDTGNLGINTTTPSYKLDVQGGSGIVAQFSGRVIGADAINTNEFVTLGQLQGGSGSLWLDGGDYLYPNSSFATNVMVPSGRLGIGLTSTPFKLEINGNDPGKALVSLNYTGTDQNILVASQSGNLKFAVGYNGNITSATGTQWLPTSDSTTALNIANAAGTSFVTFDSTNQRVGIGTTAPTTKLELGSGQLAVPLGSATTPSYTFSGDLNTGIWSSGADTLNFSTGGSERIRIISNGNVGIGTTSPGHLFQVAGSNQTMLDAAGFYNTYAYGAGNTSETRINLGKIESGTLQSMGAISARPVYDTSSTEGMLQFYTRTSGVLATSMTILNNGNVGIGTTAPTTKLELGSGQLAVPLGSATTPSYTFSGDLNTGIWSSGADTLNFSTGGSERIRIISNGNVGIGTTSPTEKLEVVGNIKANNVRHYYLTRTLPTTVGSYVEIGNFTIGNSGHNLDIAVTVTDGGFSVAKRYIIPAQYCGNCTNLQWYQVMPISSTGSYAGNDFELLIMQDNANQRITLRLLRTAGTTAGTAIVQIQQRGSTSETLTESTATGSMSIPSAFWPTTAITQVNGNVGIGTTNPTEKLEVSGNATVSGNLTFSGARTIASRAFTQLTIGDTQTGNILFSPASGKQIMFFSSSNYIDSSGNLVLAGTTGITASGTGAGLNFSGTGTHIIQASAGTLQINAFTLGGAITGNNQNISSIGNITANTSANTITGFGTIGTSGTTAFQGITATLNGTGNALTLSGAGANIAFTGAGLAQITTAASQHLALMPGGNVGIGTTTPQMKLDIAGAIGISGTTVIDASRNLTNIAGVSTHLNPTAANTYNLGTGTGNQYLNLYAQNIYQNGIAVCDANGNNCPTGGNAGPWTETSGIVYLDTPSNKVSIGDTTTEHKLEVEGAITGKALVSLWEKGDQDILVASNSATPTNVFRITNNGSIISNGTITASTTNTINGLSINNASITNAVNLTASGTITFSGLTPNRLVTTDGSSNLTTSISSANVAASVTDETGTGNLVFNTSPSFTTSITTGSTSFSILNTTATTINAFGAATTLNIGANSGTLTLGNPTVVGTQTTQNLWNTTATTINFAGAATSLNMGASSGTTTINNATLSLPNATSVNIGGASAIINLSSSTGAKQIQTGGTTNLALMPGGNVGIGTTTPVHKLELASHTTATGGIGFGTDVELYRSAADTLSLASGDSLNLVSGNLQVGSTTVITSGRIIQAANGTAASPSFTFSSDPNTGIFGTGADVLAISTAGTERVRVDATGNVGIGTTAPVNNLQLGTLTSVSTATPVTLSLGGTYSSTAGSNPKLKLWDNGSAAYGFGVSSAQLDVITGEATGRIAFFPGASATPLVLINAAGNVGIGTTGPASKLHVVGDIRHTGSLISQGANYASTWMKFDQDQYGNSLLLGSGGLTVIGGGESVDAVRGNIATGDERLVLASDISGTSIAHHFITSLQNGWANRIDAMVILGNGNVGIGTTAPIGKLNVEGAATGKALVILNETGDQAILTASKSGTTKFLIDNNGNVGIGTTSPGQLFHVSGATGAGGNLLRVTDTTNSQSLAIGGASTGMSIYNLNNTALRFGTNDTQRWQITNTGVFESSGAQTIQTSTGNLTLATGGGNGHIILSPNGTGNVGIGTTTPSYKLDVQGGTGIVAQFSGRVIGADAVNTNEFVTLGQLQGGSGSLWLDGGDYLYPNTSFATNVMVPSGRLGIGLSSTPFKFEVTGADAGKALVSLNYTGTDQNILVASQSGTLKFAVGYNGNITSATGAKWLPTSDSTTALNIANSSGTSFVTFDSTNQRVGIGTTGPGNKLSVAGGAISVTGPMSTDDGGLILSDEGTYKRIQSFASEPLYINPLGNNVILNANSGNVGIGRTSPNAKLDIAGNTAISNRLLIGHNDPNNYWINDTITGFTNGTPGDDIAMFVPVIDNSISDRSELRLYILDDANDAFSIWGNSCGGGSCTSLDAASNIATFYANGNVGIGTTAPVHKLELASHTTATGGIGFGTDVELYRSAADTLSLASGDSLNLVSGNLQVAGTTVITSGRIIQAANGTAASPSFTFSSDPNTGIFGTGADVLALSTAGTERVRVDASGNVGIGTTAPTSKLDIVTAGTTTNGISLTANSLTSGTGVSLSSTSTALTSGGLLSLDWSPTSATTATGDLLSLNIGTNGNIGKLFNIKDAGSSIFSVSESTFETSLPVNFTSPGDVSIAYDLLFTNPTASYIKSSAPLYIQAGETFNSSDLTLQTYNAGNVIIDSQALVTNQAATISGQLVVGTSTPNSAHIGNFYLTNSATFGKALAILNQTESADIFTASSSGTTRFTIANNGTLTATAYTTNNGLLYTNTSGVISQVSDTPATNECLIYNGSNILWGPCSTGGGVTGSGTTNYIPKWNSSSSLTDSTIFDNGNVGIGTTITTAGKLVVNGSTATSQLLDYDNTTYFLDPAATATSLNIAGSANIGGYASVSASLAVGYTNAPSGPGHAIFAGNVGIGTTAPTANLDVAGRIINQDQFIQSTNPLLDIYDTDGSTDQRRFRFTLSGNQLVISSRTDNGTLSQGILYLVHNSGNLGIGKSVPSAKLDVEGNASISGTLAFRGTTDPKIDVLDGENFGIRTSVGGNAGLTERLTITNNGNVGIGTTAPEATLDIFAGGATQYLRNALSGFKITVSGGINYIESAGAGMTGGADLRFTNMNAASTWMIITSTGNVGIGTTSPVHKLELASHTTATGGIGFGTDVELYRSAADTLSLASGDSLNLVSGNLQVGSTTVITSGRIIQATNGTAASPSFTFSSDTNTGIFGTGADVLALSTAGVERVRVAANGNVGIGTTTPSYKLDVQGGTGIVAQFSGRVIGADAVNTNEFVTLGQLQGGSGSLWLDGGDYLYPNTTFATNVMVPSGRLGVGLSSTPFKFEVTGADAGKALVSLNYTGTDQNILVASQSGTLKFAVGYNGNITSATGAKWLPTSDSTTALNIANSSGTSFVTFDSTNQRVGIGTTAPGALLDILGTSSQVSFGYDASNRWTQTVASDGGLSIVAAGTDADINFDLTGATDGDFSVNTNDLFVDTSLSRVGINTTLPSASLHVIAPGSTAGIKLQNSNSSGYMHLQVVNNGNQVELGSDGGTSPAYVKTSTSNDLYFGVNNSEKVRIALSGNVGIGTTAPGTKLDLQQTSDAGDTGIFIRSNTSPSTRYTSIWSGSSGSVIDAKGVTSGWGLHFYVNGGEKVRITDSGNVGIGTTAPGAKLEVNGTDAGSMVHYSGQSRGGMWALTGQRVAFATTGSTDDLVFGYGGIPVTSANFVEQMRIDTATGNVGIGTTAPGARLQIAAANQESKGLSIKAGSNLSTSTSIFEVLRADNNPIASISAGGDSGILRVGYVSNFSNNGGNWIQLSAAGANPGISINRQNTSKDQTLQFATTGTSQWLIGRFGSESTESLFFKNSSNANILALTQAGNVGIGTTTPSYKLDVQGGTGIVAQFSGRVIGADAVNTNEFVTLGQLQGGSGSLWLDGGDYLYPNTTFATNVMVPSGRLGIGLTSTPFKLEISGNDPGKALVSLNYTGTDQNILVASQSGNLKFAVGYNGNITSATGTQWLPTSDSTSALNIANAAGTSFVTFDSTNQRVGIGTTAPTTKLELGSGQLAVPLGSATTPSYTFSGDLNTGIWSSGADTLNFSTGGSERIRIISNGNVGIGTTAPGAKLHVMGDIMLGTQPGYTNKLSTDANYNLIISGVMAQNDYFKIQGTGTNDNGALEIITGDNGNEPIIFKQISGATQYERMRIDSSGNVGIGTTVPQNKLDVNGSLAVGAYAGTNTSAVANSIIVSGRLGIGTTNPGAVIDVVSTGNAARFGDMTTLTGGRPGRNIVVGSTDLGTTAGVQFEVQDGTQNSRGNISVDATNKLFIFDHTYSSGGALDYVFRTAGTELLRLTTGGNVGIGTTTPSYKLDVNGTFRSSSTSNAVFGNGTTGGIQLGDGTITKTTGSPFTMNSGLTLSQNLAVNGGSITSTVDLTLNPSGGQVFLADTDTLAIGGHAGAAYNAISNAGGTPSNPNVTSDNDLYIQGDLDIGGTLYIGGSQIANYWQRNGTTLAPITTTDSVVLGGNTSTVHQFEVNGAVTGKALVALTETGDQNIITASSSATTTVFNLSRTGAITVAAGQGLDTLAAGALNVGTTIQTALTLGRSGATTTINGSSLTIGPTSWTATPTISGLITATSGLTANGALTANNVFTLGDGGDTGSINTSDWDISTTGVLTGISGITTDGGYTQSGTATNTFTGDLSLGTGVQVDFADEVGDKLYLFSNTYGIGIESSTLTNWSASTFRWRIGGTSVSTGTEYMTLTSSALNLANNTLTSSADLTIDPTGGGVKIGTGTPNVVDLAGDDLYVTGDLEVDGTIYDSGGNAITQYWKRLAGNLSPVNLNDTISATTSASVALTITQTGAFDVVRFEDQAGDTTPFLINQDGNVGIGTANPGAKLNVSEINSGTGSDYIGNLTDISQSAAGGITTYAYRAIARATHTSGTLTGLQANSTQAYFSGSGGTTSNGEVLTSNAIISTGATVSNLRMIRVYSPTNSGTINNLIGLYLQNMSGATSSNYSIYSEGGTMYHAGNVGIGTTGPLDLLDVNGGVIIRDRAAIQGNGASCSAPSAGTAGWWYADAGDCSTVFAGINSATNGSESWGIWIGNWDWYVDVNGNVTNTGNLTVQGTTGITASGTGAGLNFSGTGTHILQASAGTLQINAFTLGGAITGNNQNISSIGNITANTSANTITGFGTIGTSGTTAFQGITATLNGTGNALTLSGAGANIAFSGAGLAQITTAASQHLALMPGGNVGIGTTTPTLGKLTVLGTTAAQAFADYDNTAYFLDPAATATSLNIAGSANIGGYATVSASLAVGYTSAPSGPGHAIFAGNVGIGTTTPVHKLELASHTTAAGGIGFGTDVELYRGAANTLYLASGDSLNLVSGNLQVAGTTVITSGRIIQATNGSATSPSFTFSSDTNTGIFGTGADVLAISTAGTERVRIAANGNVGIGTTTTDFQTTIQESTNSKGILALLGDGNQTLFTASISGSTKFLVDKTGNVGIGTTNPGTLLHVSMDSGTLPTLSSSTGLVINNNSSTSNDVSLSLVAGTAALAWLRMGDNADESAGAVIYNNSEDSMSLRVNSGTRLRITSTGKIALGASGVTELGSTNIPDGSVIIPNGAFCVDDGLNNCDDATRVAGRIYAESTTITAIDLAENYPSKDSTMEAGDLVVADPNNSEYVKKSTAAYQPSLLGVISTQPGILLGGFGEEAKRFPNDKKYPIALAGRIPVKVSTINGPIKRGDYLTSSPIPGVAMKATRAGQIIAKALEDYNNSDTNTVGKIVALVNVSWYDPQVYIANSGDLNITDNAGDFKAWVAQQPVERKAAYADAVIARLTAGIVKTKQLLVEGTATFLGSVQMQTLNVANTLKAASIEVVNTLQAGTINATTIAVNSLSIAGQNLRDYILAVVEQAGFSKNQNNITSPIADIDRIHTSVISPLASDSAILVNGKLVIKRGNEGSDDSSTSSQNNIALEVQGSASISGNLSVSDASIAGTLRAGKIIADQIEGLDARIASLAANAITATNAAIATNSTASDSGILASGSATLASLISSTIVSDYASVASFTANLAFVPNLNAQFGTFEQGLMAFGPSSLSDVSIAGQLSINGSMIFADNSINTLGADLQIQPLRQGNISFMAGLVTIDIDGNMSVAGNATFAKNVRVNGTLAAKVISPVPDEDLVFKLPGTSNSTQLAVDRPSIVVQNASGSAVLKITDEGDIIASGEANFKNIATNTFKIVRGAQADTSLTQTIATASAGTATIKAGQFERTIISPFVSEKSLIYITPVTNTNGVTPYIARQTAEDAENGIKGSFTIRIPVLQTSDVKVNWWIIN